MSHEQGNTQETVGQRFIDYVTAHSDTTPEQRRDPNQLHETFWNLRVTLPLLRDVISQVSFIVNEAPRTTGRTSDKWDRPAYDIGIHLNTGINAYYMYRPNNPDTPYTYMGTGNIGSGPIEEGDMAKILKDLKEYEEAGAMTRTKPEAS